MGSRLRTGLQAVGIQVTVVFEEVVVEVLQARREFVDRHRFARLRLEAVGVFQGFVPDAVVAVVPADLFAIAGLPRQGFLDVGDADRVAVGLDHAERVLEQVVAVDYRRCFTEPVIDSDDLLENPFGMVESYCNAVGIPYIEEALSWEPGDREEVSWYDGGSWHANLRDSDGLKPQPRRYIDISDAPDKIKSIYETVLPHYEHLYAHRLGAA